jgi:zinc transport system substrate-binding protein
MKNHRRIAWLFTAACSLAVDPALAAEVNVVVTLKPVHALVAQVMAGVGTPHLIVDGAASPHTFTLKPSGAKAISEADVFIRISEALEPFTRKVAEALPASVKLISLIDAPGVMALPQRRGETFEKHEHHEAGGANHDDDHDDDEGSGKDGHIWLDPNNAKAIVAATTKVLSETYPESAGKFAANAAAVTAKLDALTSEIEAQLAPVKNQPFVVFHDSMQYFERRFGVAAAGSVTITPDVQPSAKRLTAVRKKIADLGTVCVFAEPGFQPNLVAAVTEGSKARSGTLDPEAVLLTPGPELYFELMRGLAQNMRSCFTAQD